MSVHEQFADSLALYSLGALEGQERQELEKHLEGCSACRRELDQLRGDGALLAISVGGPKPPLRSRERLLSAIAKEKRAEPSLPPVPKPRFSWWGILGWVTAAAMVMVALQVRKENASLRGSIASLTAMIGQQTAQLEDARRVVEPMTAPDAQRVVLVAAKTPPQPQGKAFYLRNKNSLVFVANNLPPLPPDKIYELWLIPPSGSPIAAGLFRPDAHGSATVVNPPLSGSVEAKTFAVTLEPEGGPHDAPRGTAVMAGLGE